MQASAKKVWIVGAGPGDPELITVKGLKAIQQAEVILYDALVSSLLVDYAPATCRKIYVGKRKGHKEFSQEDINRLIVFYANRYDSVVRLKGGDPNVFGRGHEEMEYVIKRGMAVEFIPGISSAIAAPGAAFIPLTKRGVNESFWVVTGTTSSGAISTDIALAAQSTATVIILMGVNHLESIASLFKNLRSPEEPVAVIQEASLPGQNVAIGTAADIYDRVHELKIKSPAVIVIGKVVSESQIGNLLLAAKNEINW
jgi:uroporphyrin-III C-methyltransferase